jgi:hypothetical protein
LPYFGTSTSTKSATPSVSDTAQFTQIAVRFVRSFSNADGNGSMQRLGQPRWRSNSSVFDSVTPS